MNIKIIDTVKGWSTQKKVFSGLASLTVITGVTYGVIKLSNYISSKPKKNKLK